MAELRCTNCAGPDGMRMSFDLDLPTVVLCGYCSILIFTDLETFAEWGRNGGRRKKVASIDISPEGS